MYILSLDQTRERFHRLSRLLLAAECRDMCLSAPLQVRQYLRTIFPRRHSASIQLLSNNSQLRSIFESANLVQVLYSSESGLHSQNTILRELQDVLEELEELDRDTSLTPSPEPLDAALID